ncbi:MAG TPA: winged helix-turn-helix domain-containing protein [Gemmatimonadaceae bacterium]|nr:winged helix-turn-helix domain-containing protein [Gemmatimonadaceae bacterium]
MAIAFTEYSLRRANDESSDGNRQSGAASGLAFSPSLERAAQAPLVRFALTLNELELHRVVQLLQRGGVDISRANVEEVRDDGGTESPRDEDPSSLSFGAIEVNLPARTVRREGADVHLAPKEFDLLVALLRREGAAASREELAIEVWGSEAAALGRTIDTHVCALRRKLEVDQRRPRHIRVVSKVGYRLER